MQGPSCVKTEQLALRMIYTAWIKMMHLRPSTGSQGLGHLQRQNPAVFHLEAVIVYNFSHLFWAQSGMFL